MNIAASLEFRRRWQPGALALSARGRDLTWAELDDRTAAVAAALSAAGLERGDRVGVLAANSLEWCVFALSVLRAGAVVVPMNVRSTASELGYIVDKVGARWVAVDETGRQRLAPALGTRPGVRLVGLDDPPADDPPADLTLGALAAGPDRLASVHVEPHAPALIPFTSGTTGYPKGVTLTHDNVRAMAEAYSRFEGLGAQSVSLCFAPLAFNGGITNALLATVLVGGRLILEEFDPALALRRIAEAGVTVLTGVPLMFEAIAALPQFAGADLATITTAITGGAVVAPRLLRAWADKGVALRQSYGLTEATGPITITPAAHFRDKAHTAGVPGPWDRVRVVDDSDRDVPVGEAGEIVISGPQVMAGYWGDPEETARTLRGGWLHTGDVGCLDSDGFLAIVDRKKDLIISGGINVYPAEIERVLRDVPGVEECVAFGVPHERWGETVAVALRGGDGEEIDVDAVHAHARAHLSDHKVPRWIGRQTEPLPRNTFGKLLRRTAAQEFDPATAHRTPST